ncbi:MULTISPECIES: MFS transporter [unclassified Streptomyces]|uniref:MFS transporter n=1 Tax=unclassified Streptomyces TaxID=2593676 RepID=UPI00166019D0|nr:MULTISPECIES: MFS transporter [unclassified Streptomyces]
MTTRRAPVLACSVVGAAVVALDGTVLTVAQPALAHDLGATLGQVQWTGTGYLVAVASLLVLAGRLGDRHGHRRVFATGALGFAAASTGIALAPDIRTVIALRVLQGVCGALLQPATLGMLRTDYPPDRLGTPIAVRTAAIGLAAATGPLVGGAPATAYGWRAVFLLGVPPTLAIGILALATGERPNLREAAGRPRPPRRPNRREAPGPPRRTAKDGPKAGSPLDPGGALLLALTLGLLVHGLVAVAGTGATAGGTLSCAAALLAGLLLVRHERRAICPLLPAELLRGRSVVAGLGALLAASAALTGTLFVATWFLQDVQRLDPLDCALRFLPLAALMVPGALLLPSLQRRHGPRRTAAAGAVLLTLGVLLLSRLGADAGALPVGTGAALLGAGFVTLMVTMTSGVVRAAPESHAGVAGGLQQTAMNIGPALGTAIVTLLVALVPHGGFVPADGAALPALAVLAALTLPAVLRACPADPAPEPPHPAVPGHAGGPLKR